MKGVELPATKKSDETLCGIYRIKERGGNPFTFIEIKIENNKFVGTHNFKSGTKVSEEYLEKEILKEIENKTWARVKRIAWEKDLGDEL